MGFTDATQFWNQRFDKQEFIFGKEPNEYLVEQSSHYLKPNSSVLCIADGEGRNGVWLAKQGMRVTGFDVSDIAIAKANQLAADNEVNIQYSLCDTDGFDWQANTYDTVVGIFIQFADPVLRSRIFAAMADALNPGGLILLQGYRPEQIAYGTGGPKLVENLYSEAMLRSAFAELEILDLAVHDSVIREGDGHDGMSALIDLVARKPVQATGPDVR
jgi:SAM-dependent methyltransferase